AHTPTRPLLRDRPRHPRRARPDPRHPEAPGRRCDSFDRRPHPRKQLPGDPDLELLRSRRHDQTADPPRAPQAQPRSDPARRLIVRRSRCACSAHSARALCAAPARSAPAGAHATLTRYCSATNPTRRTTRATMNRLLSSFLASTLIWPLATLAGGLDIPALGVHLAQLPPDSKPPRRSLLPQAHLLKVS